MRVEIKVKTKDGWLSRLNVGDKTPYYFRPSQFRGYIDKVGGKFYIHSQTEVPDSIDLSKAVGPFPSLKAAKAAYRVLPPGNDCWEVEG